MFYFMTEERSDAALNPKQIVRFVRDSEAHGDYVGPDSYKDSLFPPLPNPLNDVVLCPDPNSVYSIKKSKGYLKAVPHALAELEERRSTRERWKRGMERGEYKKIKVMSEGLLNCEVQFNYYGNRASGEIKKGTIRKYSERRKKWLFTETKKNGRKKGFWIDLAKNKDVKVRENQSRCNALPAFAKLFLNRQIANRSRGRTSRSYATSTTAPRAAKARRRTYANTARRHASTPGRRTSRPSPACSATSARNTSTETPAPTPSFRSI